MSREAESAGGRDSDYGSRCDAKSVALEILDAQGAIVRRYTSEDAVRRVKDASATGRPDWQRPLLRSRERLDRTARTRDLHYPPPKTDRSSIQSQRSLRQTMLEQRDRGDTALERSSARLTVDGATTTQPLVVVMYPRAKTPLDG